VGVGQSCCRLLTSSSTCVVARPSASGGFCHDGNLFLSSAVIVGSGRVLTGTKLHRRVLPLSPAGSAAAGKRKMTLAIDHIAVHCPHGWNSRRDLRSFHVGRGLRVGQRLARHDLLVPCSRWRRTRGTLGVTNNSSVNYDSNKFKIIRIKKCYEIVKKTL
jgi:hypothetical protein